jgi:hypothetical protein
MTALKSQRALEFRSGQCIISCPQTFITDIIVLPDCAPYFFGERDLGGLQDIEFIGCRPELFPRSFGIALNPESNSAPEVQVSGSRANAGLQNLDRTYAYYSSA